MTGRRPSPGLLPYPLREPLYNTSTLCHCHLPGKTFPDVAIDGNPISAELRLAALGATGGSRVGRIWPEADVLFPLGCLA